MVVVMVGGGAGELFLAGERRGRDSAAAPWRRGSPAMQGDFAEQKARERRGWAMGAESAGGPLAGEGPAILSVSLWEM